MRLNLLFDEQKEDEKMSGYYVNDNIKIARLVNY